jgi:glycosyltransferase involved in cell wall biosynthesis
MSRICMITALAGPGSVAGGVWEVVVNQATALREAGHEVSIVAGWLGPDPPAELRGLPVTLVPVRPLVGRLALRGLIGRGWSQAVRMAAEGADVAHVHLCRDYLTMTATRTLSRAATPVPIVAQTHGMLSSPRSRGFALFDQLMTRPALRRTQRLITLTEHEKPVLQGLGVPPERLTTIQNAVPEPPTRWSPTGTSKPQRLLFASRLHPRKQVMVFAEMVVRLHQQGHTVEGIVAGPDQGDLPRLQEFIRRDDHATFLTYIGELDRRQLGAQFATATVFVFPARSEPFGLVLLEALSVGTPVVSTSETPLATTMAQAGAAVVSSPDVDSLSQAVARLLSDPKRQESLSRNGHELYQAQWTSAAMAQRLAELYRHAAAPTDQQAQIVT